ncbi:MAG: hypothetical protein NTZ16_14145 [Verrucomicrobia bacterium]|nr:hypothetical protein [Verrucomicrobiota bacterium]
MKRERLMAVVGLAVGLFLIPAARAVVSGDNPYKSIVERNPFGLLPPPPPPPPPDTNPPPSNIKLTGITTILGIKNALLMAQEPGPGGKSQSYILTEGQREGQIEVLTIDSVAGSVKVSNAGAVATLTFDKDGMKAPAAPATAPGTMPTLFRPGMPIPPAPAPGQPVPTGNYNPIQPGGGTVPSANPGSGLRQIPTRSLRMPQSSAQLNAPAAQSTLSPEEQILQQAIHAQVNKEEILNRGLPYPPMPGIPGLTDTPTSGQ